MVIVHDITATQKSADVPSGKFRSDDHGDAQNIAPASIGPSKAVGHVTPEPNCKLIDMVFPVPTSNVSAMDQHTSRSQLLVTKQTLEGPLKGIMDYTDDGFLFCVFNSDTHSLTFDAVAGIDLSDNFVELISCYDNEYEYSNEAVNLMACMSSKCKNNWTTHPSKTRRGRERLATLGVQSLCQLSQQL